MERTLKSFRLPEQTVTLLDELQRSTGYQQTEIIIMAVELFAKQQAEFQQAMEWLKTNGLAFPEK